jgi:hypothetical protein
MADPNVQIYLQRAAGTSHQPNTSIVDVATADYLTTLTAEEREDAEQEVALMMWTEDWPDWERRLLLVAGLRELRHRIRGHDVLLAAVDAQAWADAIAAAAQASADAAAALEAAETAAAGAVTAAQAAETSGTAAQAAQAAAAIASAAAEALAQRHRIALSATSLSAITVAAGAGTPTPILWPSGAIRSAPYTEPAGTWSLASGVLHCAEPGVYQYTLSASFTTGLLTAGTFRFALEVGGVIDTTHAVQVALLNVAAGVSASGVVVIPSGGADVVVKAGHTALIGTQINIDELKLSLVKVS